MAASDHAGGKGWLTRAVAVCCAALILLALTGCDRHQSWQRPAPEKVYVNVQQIARAHPLLLHASRLSPPRVKTAVAPEAQSVASRTFEFPDLAKAPAAVTCPSGQEAAREGEAISKRFAQALNDWLATSQTVYNRELASASYPWLADLDGQRARTRQETLANLLSTKRPELRRLALQAQLASNPADRSQARAELARQLADIKHEADLAADTRATEVVFSAQLMAQQSVSDLQWEFQQTEEELAAAAEALDAQLKQAEATSGVHTKKLCAKFETKAVTRSEKETRQVRTAQALAEVDFDSSVPVARETCRQALAETEALVKVLCRSCGKIAYTDAQSKGKLPDATDEVFELARQFWAGQVQTTASGPQG